MRKKKNLTSSRKSHWMKITRDRQGQRYEEVVEDFVYMFIRANYIVRDFELKRKDGMCRSKTYKTKHIKRTFFLFFYVVYTVAKLEKLYIYNGLGYFFF